MRHLSAKQYACAWLEILKTTAEKNKKPATRGLIFNLYKNGRLNLLPAILLELEELEARENEVTAVAVKAAKEYGADFIANVAKKLLPGKKLNIRQEIDQRLLGGLVVETKNQRWNLDLRSQLNKLAQQIIS